MIDLLIRKGADVNSLDIVGFTPFTFLLIRNLPENIGKSVSVFLKEFSRLSFENLLISEDNARALNGTRLKECFENCKKELIRMSGSKFYANYSYYDVFKMSKNMNKLAKLAKNEEFVLKFEENLSFPDYGDDLRRIFDEAKRIKEKSEFIICRLKQIYSEHLPDIVIRILAENLSLEDLPQK